jgi:protein gp37
LLREVAACLRGFKARGGNVEEIEVGQLDPIHWTTVSQKVNRTVQQCQQKWYEQLRERTVAAGVDLGARHSPR